MRSIPFNKPFTIGRELTLIADAVARGHISGDGYYTKACSIWFKERSIVKKPYLRILVPAP